jgi:hypothetical protein
MCNMPAMEIEVEPQIRESVLADTAVEAVPK